jgi:hypothetical protein
VDSDGVAVSDNRGYPIFRPANMPPERYLQAADIAARDFLGEYAGLKDLIEQNNLPNDAFPSASTAMLAGLYSALLPVSPGGSLDAERFDLTRVTDYRHYLNIMIGAYGARLGLDEDEVLSAIDFYAELFSRFGPNEQMDNVYAHSAGQDVEDTKTGYRLYRSGRIRLKDQ